MNFPVSLTLECGANQIGPVLDQVDSVCTLGMSRSTLHMLHVQVLYPVREKDSTS